MTGRLTARLTPGSTGLALLAITGATVLWGTAFIVTKPLLPHVPPLTLALLRVIVALAVLLPLLHRTGRRPARGWTPAVLGLTGVALAVVCQNLGLGSASAADAVLILNGGIPMLTLGLAALVLRERLAARGLLGAVASIAGVATLVVWGASAATLGASLHGTAFLLASAAAFAFYD
ncbi:MAG: EamA family transporter, partial [Dehalococcoidia bacterium]